MTHKVENSKFFWTRASFFRLTGPRDLHINFQKSHGHNAHKGPENINRYNEVLGGWGDGVGLGRAFYGLHMAISTAVEKIDFERNEP